MLAGAGWTSDFDSRSYYADFSWLGKYSDSTDCIADEYLHETIPWSDRLLAV